MNKVLLRPDRLRQVPAQFSWIDQRLARHCYFQQASAESWTLYLFLLTVADAQGLSYYAERTLCRRLDWSPTQLASARQPLLELELIAYQQPLYQVLALPPTPIKTRRLPAEAAEPHLRQLRHLLKHPGARR